MKIAVYYNLTNGGADRAFFEILKRLVKKHKLDIYTLDTQKNKRELLLDRLPVRYFRFKIFLPRNFFLFQFFIYSKLIKLQKQIAQIINSRNYDVVLLTDDYLIRTPLILRFLKINSLYFCQTHYREFYDPFSIFSHSLKYKIVNSLRLPLKWLDKKSFKLASIVVTNSKYTQNRLAKIHKRKIYRLKLGVEIKNNKIKDLPREKFFLTVGSLSIFKGIVFLIRSLALLPLKDRYPLVIVANSGPDEKYIKNLAKKVNVKLEIKKGIWKGLADKRLIELYNKARLFLYAPYYEPFGLVVLEAMVCGLPVVGVKEGGLKETIIEAKNGWLAPRDPKKFAFKISQALAMVDKKFRRQTYNLVKKWNWEQTGIMLEQLLIKTKQL